MLDHIRIMFSMNPLWVVVPILLIAVNAAYVFSLFRSRGSRRQVVVIELLFVVNALAFLAMIQQVSLAAFAVLAGYFVLNRFLHGGGKRGHAPTDAATGP